MVIRCIFFVFCFLTISQTHAQTDSCSNFYDYFTAQDYQNTIKSIQNCKKNNYISEKDKIIFDYFLNISYYALGDYTNFSGKSLEDALKNSNGIINGLYVQIGYLVLKNYYSEVLDKSKEREIHISFLAQSLKNYGDNGNYKEAIKISDQLLKEVEIFYGKNDYFADILHNQAYYYAILGNFEKAISLNRLSLNVLKEINADNNIRYVSKLSFLASYYSFLGNNEESITVAERCLDKLANIGFDENNNDAISIYHNISICYAKSNNIDRAIQLQKKALTIAKIVLNENQIEYGLILNNLAKLNSDIGNYNDALSYGEQSIKIFNNNRSHALRFAALNNLAFIYLNVRDFTKSYQAKNDFFYSVQNFIIPSQFLWLSDGERSLYWESVKNYILELPYYCLKSDNFGKFSELSFNSALLSKSILLQSTKEIHRILMESGNEKVMEKVSQLRTLYQTLNKLYEKPISERYLNTDSLETVSQNLERKLLAESKEYGDYTRFMSVTWQDVQKNLKERDVAIEFVEFPIIESDSVMYAALVLKKDWKKPKMIPLFEKRQLDQFLNQTPDKLYSGYMGKQLSRLMWKPLEEVIKKGDDIYFSAAGVYYQLALEYLPSDEGIPLCDLYNFRRLSSTRQLVLEKQNTTINSAALYGGIQYDVNPTEMASESKKYQLDENLYAYRGMSTDSLRGNAWVPLDNTIPEIEFISGELSGNHITTTVFTGIGANEESIKSLSGKKTNILHLATHGFFFPAEETRKINYFQMPASNNSAPDMSMRRSGLIMAGGNRAWSGDTIPEGVDDGILTAQEISILDFRKMDLVVLSACETGLGDISTSEGVFGLQRAFKKAGANTLVMSLWKVNDQVTKLLMSKFYQNLMEGKSKHDAFLEAQQFIRSRHPEPQNWAAFVMLD